MARLPKLLWLTGLSVVLASAVLPGCGDDDGGDDETGGKGGAATGGKAGGTTGGKGGAAPTGGKGGGTTGGSTQGGEAGAPVGTGGAPVGTGGAGGAVEPPGGAGAGGVPVVGGAGAGGVPDIGGAGGVSGGESGGVGGGDVGGSGGDDVGGAGGTDGEAGGGGDGGTGGEVALVACSATVANSASPPYTDGIGLDCEDICDAFATGACDDENPYASEAACLAECTGRPELSICCRATHAAAAATDGAANVERHCAAAAGDEFEGSTTCN
jgi:hypothetical protein